MENATITPEVISEVTPTPAKRGPGRPRVERAPKVSGKKRGRPVDTTPLRVLLNASVKIERQVDGSQKITIPFNDINGNRREETLHVRVKGRNLDVESAD